MPSSADLDHKGGVAFFWKQGGIHPWTLLEVSFLLHVRGAVDLVVGA